MVMQAGFHLNPFLDKAIEKTMRITGQRRTPQPQIKHREQFRKALNPAQKPINLPDKGYSTGRAAFRIPLMGSDDIRTRIVGKPES